MKKNLFEPATTLFNRFHLAHKFTLLFLLLILPLLYYIPTSINASNKEINNAELKYHGLEYLDTLRPLFVHMAKTRGVTYAYINGDHRFKNVIEANRLAVKRNFATLIAIDKKLNTTLDTKVKVALIKRIWDDALAMGTDQDANTTFDKYSETIAQTFLLMQHVIHSSGLMLDTQADIHALSDAVGMRIPLLIEGIGKARGIGAGISARKEHSKESFIHLSGHLNNIDNIEDAINRSYLIAFNDDGIQEKLQKSRHAASSATHKFIQASYEKLLQNKNSIDSSLYFDLGTTAIAANIKIHNQSLELLNRTLEKRIQHLNKNIINSMAISVFLALGTIYLLIGFYHSVKASNQLGEELTKSIKTSKDHAMNISMLQAATTELSSTQDMEKILKLLSSWMTRSLNSTYSRIILIDPKTNEPVIRSGYSLGEFDWNQSIGKTLPLKKFPTLNDAITSHRHIIIQPENIGQLSAEEKENLITRNTSSAIIFPITQDQFVLGAIIFGESRNIKREPITEKKIYFCQSMVNQAAIAISNAYNYTELNNNFMDTIITLAATIDAKSPWTHGHSSRVCQYSLSIGEKLGLNNIELTHLKYGCLLHDIGKISIPEGILDKPGKLTKEEYDIIKTHPEKGVDIIKLIKPLQPALSIITHHHESFDGRGYPHGLKGKDIPYMARIAAVADAYDAMTADRPYRKGMGNEKAISILRDCTGSQFDPDIAGTFVGILEQGYDFTPLTW